MQRYNKKVTYARGRGVFGEKSGKEGGYRGSRSKSTNTEPEGRGSRARGISYESRTLGEGGEGGKDGHFGTEVDKMAPRNGQNGTKVDNLAGFGYVAQTLHYLWRKR